MIFNLINVDKGHKYTRDLETFIEAYNLLVKGDYTSKDIVTFYEYLCERFTTLKEQEDCHELLLYIISGVNDFVEWKNSQDNGSPKGKSFLSLLDFNRKAPSNKEILVNPLTGVYQNYLKCEICETESRDRNDKKDTLSI